MNPPDDSPDTLVFVLSTFSAGSGTAWASVKERAAAPRVVRINFLKVIESLLRLGQQPLAPVLPGFLERIKKRRGRACGSPWLYFRPLRTGTSISFALISLTSERSGIAPGRAPGETRKWYI